MTVEETIVFDEYIAMKKVPEPVAWAMRRLCEKVKAARPDAVMFHTDAQLCFRTPYSRNGNGIEIQAAKKNFRISLRKPNNPEYQKGDGTGTGKCFYRFFIVLEIDRYHPEVTDEKYEELVFDAALDSYDQAVEEYKCH